MRRSFMSNGLRRMRLRVDRGGHRGGGAGTAATGKQSDSSGDRGDRGGGR